MFGVYFSGTERASDEVRLTTGIDCSGYQHSVQGEVLEYV